MDINKRQKPMIGLMQITTFPSRWLRPLALALALTAALSGTRVCLGGTFTDLELSRKDLGSDVRFQSSFSNMVILGTVERVKPKEHWVQIFHDQPPPTVMTSEAFEAMGGGIHQDIYFTDVTIKVSEYLRKPTPKYAPPTIELRVYGHGPDDVVMYNNDRIELEANFKPGEKVLLFIKRNPLHLEIKEMGLSDWTLTSKVFSKFSQLEPDLFLQNGDSKFGGSKKYTRDELMRIISNGKQGQGKADTIPPFPGKIRRSFSTILWKRRKKAIGPASGVARARHRRR
jgi:hypothetical protein